MRLYELEQQPRGRPEIFLDMDGVLADFFSEYAKLAGVPADVRSGRADYRNIPAELREPVIAQMRGTDFFYRLPKFPSADRLVAMVVEVFGLPGQRFVYSPTEDFMTFCFKSKKDAELCKILLSERL